MRGPGAASEGPLSWRRMHVLVAWCSERVPRWQIVLELLWSVPRRMIYFPLRHVVPAAASVLPGAEDVSFETADGLRLNGWYISAAANAERRAVIVFNGNAGNRAFRAPLAAALREAGLSVLLFDYRGYGGNPGSPSEPGLVADARAARAYVVHREDVDPDRLVYFGESLGAAVAVALAVEHPPAAMVLRSPFTSLVDMGRLVYPFLPVRPLLRDRFDAISQIRQLLCPLLVVAGDRDSIVPPEQSRRLRDAAPGPKRFALIPGADHNDFALVAGQPLMAVVTEFLRSVSKPG